MTEMCDYGVSLSYSPIVLREILQTMGFEIIAVKSLFIMNIKYSGLA